jgi:hypothetical protein
VNTSLKFKAGPGLTPSATTTASAAPPVQPLA